jgi:uncharacterized protein (TIGR00369 family)
MRQTPMPHHVRARRGTIGRRPGGQDRGPHDRSAFFWQIQDGKLPPPRAAATLGISIREVSPEAGTIELEFEGKAEFTNPAGHIQGGFPVAMLDDTMGPALAATLGAGEFAPTLNLNVSFARPAVAAAPRAAGV